MANGSRMSRGEREAYWRGVIQSWESSGKSMKGYCLEAGLSYPSFQWWKSELRRRDRKRAVVPVFAEVCMASCLPAPASAGVEVALAHERVVRVHPGFDAGTLAAVVRVLEGL